MSVAPPELSSYAESLNQEAKSRYIEKIAFIDGVDPFRKVITVGEPYSGVPPVKACDLVSYLVLQTSFITSSQFKARKGLEAYNQFVCGWIKDVHTRKISGKYLTCGRVRHSQRLNDTPLNCWIILESTGEVCCAHCTCMAGLGETCSHIAAVLFYLEAAARIQGTSITCTQEACQWLIPSYLKSVEYLPIKEIDFTSAKGKKRKLDEAIDQDTDPTNITEVSVARGKVPSESEMDLLFENLSFSGTKPAILSLIPKYADSYMPKSSSSDFPQPLKSLKQSSYVDLDYHELLKVCESASVEITAEMAKLVEKATRSQSQSKLWFKYRAGRITASRMKAVCHTDAGNPAQSLIKSICYPEAFSFTTKATQWGCKHEKVAQQIYYNTSRTKHNDLCLTESGLVISLQWPFVGASPDGVVDCTCCGKGVLEIKCPYCHRENDLQTAAAQDTQFCLKTSHGELHLDHNHAYYYQIQTQLFVCDVEYADFCVCTFMAGDDQKGNSQDSQDSHVHIERIYKDHSFWTECITKAQHFFRTCLLPEIMGNWYTRPTGTTFSSNHDEQLGSSRNMESHVIEYLSENSNNCDQSRYCYCRGQEAGTMIGCDNPDCPIEWFHIKCLQLRSIPKGKSKESVTYYV